MQNDFAGEQSVPDPAARRDADPPAAALSPAKLCREFPLSRPLERRLYAESSDTLHCLARLSHRVIKAHGRSTR